MFNERINYLIHKQQLLSTVCVLNSLIGSYNPDCMIEDKNRVGFPYYHISHQIEGISACSIHGNRLIEIKNSSGIPLYSRGTITTPALPAQKAIAAKVEELTELSLELLTSGYLRLMEEKGYYTPDRKREAFNLYGFYEELADWAGEEVLNELGLAIKPDDLNRRNLWLNKLVGRGKTTNVNPPVVHLLIMAAFDLTKEFFLINEDKKLKTLPCKNPYCGGEATYAGNDSLREYYRCRNCNMVFSGNGRIMQTGELWRELTEEELKQGIKPSTLSKKQGFYPDFVTRWLKRDPLELDHRLESFKETAKEFKSREIFRKEEANKYKLLKALNSEFLDEIFGKTPIKDPVWLYGKKREEKNKKLKNLEKELAKLEILSESKQPTIKNICTKLGISANTLKRDYPEIHERVLLLVGKRSLDQSRLMTDRFNQEQAC